MARTFPAWGGTDRRYAKLSDAAVVGRAISEALWRARESGTPGKIPADLENPKAARAYLKSVGQPSSMAGIIRAQKAKAAAQQGASWPSAMSLARSTSTIRTGRQQAPAFTAIRAAGPNRLGGDGLTAAKAGAGGGGGRSG